MLHLSPKTYLQKWILCGYHLSSITVILTVIFVSLLPSIANASTNSKNIPVPFTSQAPYAYWGQPWQDTCEETAIVMVDNFYREKTLTTKQIAKDEIMKILNIKNKNFGLSLDENAEQMVKLINEFLPWEGKIIIDPTLEQIKNEINNKQPVIIPVHGKYLYNPHFKNGGPDYHTLVISGYDDNTQEFITQEPGTRYGQNFHYSYNTILNAMHDFLPNYQTKNGPKTTIFTQKWLDTSQNADGDQDGLIKAEEIKSGTITWLFDSDGDGFSDGQEVSSGFSPILAETKLITNTLVKTQNSPKIYLTKNNNKYHILNEQVFFSHSWSWSEVKIVSEKFLNNLEEKEEISE